MGATNGKQLIKKYWLDSKKGLTVSQDDRAIKACFERYDLNKSGALEIDEALAYINDLLRVSGLDKKIYEEAAGAGANPQDYYGQYVMNIFTEMDKSKSGSISMGDLLKPKETIWSSFLRFVSVKTLHEAKKKDKAAGTTKAKDGDDDSESLSIDSEDLKSEEEPKPPAKEKQKQRRPSKPSTPATDEPAKSDASKPTKKPKKKPTEEPATAATATATPTEAMDEHAKVQATIERAKSKSVGRAALTESGLMAMRDKAVEAVVEILGTEYSTAQKLLNYYRWDKEKLLAEWADDFEKVCKEAAVTLTGKPGEAKDTEEQKEEIECSICADDTTEYTTLPGCNHQFCNSCWGDNLAIQIKEGHTLDIHCMYHNCKQLVPENIVRKLVPEALFKKYSSFLSKAFVDNSRDVKWCTAPNCGKAIVEPTWEGDNLIGHCACGNMFCWRCNLEAHTPCSCNMMKEWEEQNSKDMASLLMIRDSTKPCPKCKTAIEKNDGCFQMTCGKCYFQFCWLCLDPWSTHSDHFRCAKYSDGKLQDKPEWKDGKQGDMAEYTEADTYFRWYTRYQAYEDALKLEERNWADTLRKISRVVENNISVDPSFLAEAHNQLQNNRRILKYLCVALCIEKNPLKQELLQQFHGSFEMLTEKLAQKSEKHQDIATMGAAEIRELTKVSRKNVNRLLGEEDD